MGAVAKSYMREGFLIYEEMRKYLLIYEEAVSHIDFATAPFWIFLCMGKKLCFLFYQYRQSNPSRAVQTVSIRCRVAKLVMRWLAIWQSMRVPRQPQTAPGLAIQSIVGVQDVLSSPPSKVIQSHAVAIRRENITGRMTSGKTTEKKGPTNMSPQNSVQILKRQSSQKEILTKTTTTYTIFVS